MSFGNILDENNEPPRTAPNQPSLNSHSLPAPKTSVNAGPLNFPVYKSPHERPAPETSVNG